MKQVTLEQLTLSELRRLSGEVKQAVVALEMNVQEPAVSKLEKKKVEQATLDKLVRFVHAIGGSLALSVTLPDGTVLELGAE